MSEPGLSQSDLPPQTHDAIIGEREVWKQNTCILYECNCGIEIKLDGRRFERIRGDKRHPSSAGYTCETALRLDHYQNGCHRLTSPLRRNPDGTHEEIDWETAIREVSERLKGVRDGAGGDKIFFYGGGGQGNHLGGSTYGKALQAALGARYFSHALAQDKTGEMWVDGKLYGGHTKGDFEHAEVVVFLGKDPWQTHGFPRARPTLTSWCVIAGEACSPCSRSFSGHEGAFGDEAGDGSVGLGQAITSVGPAHQLLPPFMIGQGVLDGDAVR